MRATGLVGRQYAQTPRVVAALVDNIHRDQARDAEVFPMTVVAPRHRLLFVLENNNAAHGHTQQNYAMTYETLCK